MKRDTPWRQGIDLDDEEWGTFARAIEQLALQREKSQNFKPFQARSW